MEKATSSNNKQLPRLPQELQDRIIGYAIPPVLHATLYMVHDDRYRFDPRPSHYMQVDNGTDFATFLDIICCSKAYNIEAKKQFAQKVILNIDLVNNGQCNAFNGRQSSRGDTFQHWEVQDGVLDEIAYQASAVSRIRNFELMDVSVIVMGDGRINFDNTPGRRQGARDMWCPEGYLRSISASFTINAMSMLPKLDSIKTEGFTIGYDPTYKEEYARLRQRTMEGYQNSIETVLDLGRHQSQSGLQRIGMLHNMFFMCGRDINIRSDRQQGRHFALKTMECYMDVDSGEWVDEEELLA